MGSFFRIVGTDPYALTAINTLLGVDSGVSLTDTDRFRRTALQTMRAPLTLGTIKGYRMLVLYHNQLLPQASDVDLHRDGRSSAELCFDFH